MLSYFNLFDYVIGFFMLQCHIMDMIGDLQDRQRRVDRGGRLQMEVREIELPTPVFRTLESLNSQPPPENLVCIAGFSLSEFNLRSH